MPERLRPRRQGVSFYMKLLTLNRIELIQDRLDIEDEIGKSMRELKRLEQECYIKAMEIEALRFNLLQLNNTPNDYVRRKNFDQEINRKIAFHFDSKITQ